LSSEKVGRYLAVELGADVSCDDTSAYAGGISASADEKFRE
jgi:hypothetical protein